VPATIAFMCCVDRLCRYARITDSTRTSSYIRKVPQKRTFPLDLKRTFLLDLRVMRTDIIYFVLR
jgi:hypothetical protein